MPCWMRWTASACAAMDVWLALKVYENRVYQAGMEDGPAVNR